MMQGLGPCKVNPDLWFPEMPQGRPSISIIAKVAENVSLAISLCEVCPARWQCAEEGMKEENLPYGIWGGTMAGERLVATGYKLQDFPKDSDEYKAIKFTVLMTPLVRWQDANL